jgi:hypothetical protein
MHRSRSPCLAAVVVVWPKLPTSIRHGILAIVLASYTAQDVMDLWLDV